MSSDLYAGQNSAEGSQFRSASHGLMLLMMSMSRAEATITNREPAACMVRLASEQMYAVLLYCRRTFATLCLNKEDIVANAWVSITMCNEVVGVTWL